MLHIRNKGHFMVHMTAHGVPGSYWVMTSKTVYEKERKQQQEQQMVSDMNNVNIFD